MTSVLRALSLLAILGAVSVQGCGQSAVKPNLGHLYIVGGTEAQPHSWPWMVTVQSPVYGHSCGGSLLNHRWILTAAHCVDYYKDQPKAIIVGLGYHNLEKPSSTSRMVEIRKIKVHHGWNSQTMVNDIALLELAEHVPYEDAVQPVCLPPARKEWEKNTKFVVTGWGLTDPMGMEISPTLQQVTVPLVEPEVCNSQDWLDGAVDPDIMLCAGYEGGVQDSCRMDSGGPLVTLVGDRWQQAGVVSWGIDCGKPKQPGVYAHVSQYITWIESIINSY